MDSDDEDSEAAFQSRTTPKIYLVIYYGNNGTSVSMKFKYPNALRKFPWFTNTISQIEREDAYRKDNNMALMDFVPSIQRVIGNAIESHFMVSYRKQAFLATLSSHFHQIVSYDDFSYQHITFLVQTNLNVGDNLSKFVFLLTVDLPDSFPEAPPQVSFRSIHLSSKLKPYKGRAQFNYDPSESNEKNAKMIYDTVIQLAPSFHQATASK
eukprot:CAMPEP_0117425618 /NCGR_PEP_ID=MMETSP0758-20121206/5867_1 /TAXON_ID=63605 /ORGANISM="Percolomonas cosmopolitus, Strain AE-1 (ATCC 50343)" /LENGTH=209 /DNA_ID=CAMNT_0005210237 /DNA_START=578 /DNA_END=1207 /DNA_ORIENTATION=-